MFGRCSRSTAVHEGFALVNKNIYGTYRACSSKSFLSINRAKFNPGTRRTVVAGVPYFASFICDCILIVHARALSTNKNEHYYYIINTHKKKRVRR